MDPEEEFKMNKANTAVLIGEGVDNIRLALAVLFANFALDTEAVVLGAEQIKSANVD